MHLVVACKLAHLALCEDQEGLCAVTRDIAIAIDGIAFLGELLLGDAALVLIAQFLHLVHRLELSPHQHPNHHEPLALQRIEWDSEDLMEFEERVIQRLADEPGRVHDDHREELAILADLDVGQALPVKLEDVAFDRHRGPSGIVLA